MHYDTTTLIPKISGSIKIFPIFEKTKWSKMGACALVRLKDFEGNKNCTVTEKGENKGLKVPCKHHVREPKYSATKI